MTAEDQKIHFDMPNTEDFRGAVALVRSTGAKGVGGRHFVIDGPTMTLAQVAALLQLFRWSWDERQRFKVTFDPPVDPYGDVDHFDADRWWAEQLSSGPRPRYRGLG